MDLFQTVVAKAMGALPLLWPRGVSRFAEDVAPLESWHQAEPVPQIEHGSMGEARGEDSAAEGALVEKVTGRTAVAHPVTAHIRQVAHDSPVQAERDGSAERVLPALTLETPPKQVAEIPVPDTTRGIASAQPRSRPPVQAQVAPPSPHRQEPVLVSPAGRAPREQGGQTKLPEAESMATRPMLARAQPPLLVPAAPLVLPVAVRARDDRTAAAPAAPEGDDAPVIEVTIGRVDVRAVTAHVPERPEATRARRVSLDEYLRRRGGSDA
ncbi:MAG: hypothetical protein ACRENP_05050 [Longimicrobiales bacterium]